MKVIALIITLMLATGLNSAELARDFTLLDINDREISLYDDIIGDQIIIIDFWASWCVPCMRYMPELEKINNEYDEILVVGISIDNPRSVNRAKSLIRSQKYTMINLFDTNQEVMERYQVTTVPHTFVLGYNGEIIFEHTGYSRGDEDKLIEIIQEYKNNIEG